jgi:hypothetical protein
VNNIQVLFDYPIVQTIELESLAVIRLEIPPNINYNENVFGVSEDGQLLWQIKKVALVYTNSPYVNLSKHDSLVVAQNWDGLSLWLEPATGKIVKSFYGK